MTISMVVLSEPLQSGADVVLKLREHAKGKYDCALDLVPPLSKMLEREP